MKGDKLFRLDPDAIKEVQDFKELFDIETEREALNKLIKEAWHTRKYLRYVLEHKDASKEEPECLRRILFSGSFFCAKHAPRITELPTLDICRACKYLVIAAWTKVAAHPSVSSGTSLESPDTAKPKKRIIEVYCNSGGLNVVKSACDRCNNPCGKEKLFDV